MGINNLDFNHISKDLSEEDVEKLKKLYSTYHRNCICYKWKYKRLKRLKLFLNMATIALTSIGVIAGATTLNPIILGSISGTGILVQGYVTKSNIASNVSKCKYAYTSYEKMLSLIKSHLRGVPYDESTLLTELRLIDEIVAEQCPPLGKIQNKYSRVYTDNSQVTLR